MSLHWSHELPVVSESNEFPLVSSSLSESHVFPLVSIILSETHEYPVVSLILMCLQ